MAYRQTCVFLDKSGELLLDLKAQFERTGDEVTNPLRIVLSIQKSFDFTENGEQGGAVHGCFPNRPSTTPLNYLVLIAEIELLSRTL